MLWVLIRSTSLTYVFMENWKKYLGIITKYSPSGFKLAQKFREKWLLPPDKTGRSFIGWGRSQDSVYLSSYWKCDIKDSRLTLPHCLGELTKKETNFTVDLFILTSKPIKCCKVTQIWVGQMHYIWTHKFIHIFLEIDNPFQKIQSKHQDLWLDK